jgi:hypothetical protein
MNGPFLASVNDTTIFAMPGGLKEKLQGTGLRLIADRGYSGHDQVISVMSSRDSPEVSKIKTRARMRHEGVNAKIKTLRCTDSARFRHTGTYKNGQSKFKICFEALSWSPNTRWRSLSHSLISRGGAKDANCWRFAFDILPSKS